MAFWLVTRLIHNYSNRVMIELCTCLIENKLTLPIWILLKHSTLLCMHNKLMFKFNAYGFDDLLYSWIREFLFNRYQCVKVGNCSSSVCNVISGVPLYLYYILTILAMLQNNYTNTVTFQLFADDAKFYSCINNLKYVETRQNCLDSVLQWAEVWQLTLSVAKCKILILGN